MAVVPERVSITEIAERTVGRLPENISDQLRIPLTAFVEFIDTRPFVSGLAIVMHPEGSPERRVLSPRSPHRPAIELWTMTNREVDIMRDAAEMRALFEFIGEHFQPIEGHIETTFHPADMRGYTSTEDLGNKLAASYPSEDKIVLIASIPQK